MREFKHFYFTFSTRTRQQFVFSAALVRSPTAAYFLSYKNLWVV